MILVCFWARSAFCDLKIDGPKWRLTEKFDPPTLSKTLGDHAGKLIGVQFNFRGKDIRHMKPNWYEGSIWQRDPKARKGFSNVRVMVAKRSARVQVHHNRLDFIRAAHRLRPRREGY